MRPIYFIDFEASGIAPDSYPIELTIVSDDMQHQALIQRGSACLWGRDRRSGADLNQRLSGAVICADSPQDSFWLDTLYEAAGIEPAFTLQPIESFVGREAAGEITRLMTTRKAHRALPDALDLKSAVEAYFGTSTKK